MLEDDNPHGLPICVEGVAFKNAVKRIPEELLSKNEEELRVLAKPTRTDYAIRTALWAEYRHVRDTGNKIPPARIYEGICAYQHWYHEIINVPEKLAWILQPIDEFERQLEPLLIKISERYQELINLNIYDKKGQVIPSVAKIVLEAMKGVEYRLKGAAVQRVENKTLSISATTKDIQESDRMIELSKQLKELEKLDLEAQHVTKEVISEITKE